HPAQRDGRLGGGDVFDGHCGPPCPRDVSGVAMGDDAKRMRAHPITRNPRIDSLFIASVNPWLMIPDATFRILPQMDRWPS
ncbi:MAG TPA: hypothetical protein VFQ54_01830, partial [Thermomicrobiales bacterium]|nr:hypothetical protein [Thermomicrobiales bacterium]